MKQQIVLKWLGGWVSLVVLSILVTEGMHFATADRIPNEMQITLALCISLLAIFLLPAGSDHKHSVSPMLLWSGMSTVGFLIITLFPQYYVHGNQSLQLAGGVFVLLLLFGSLFSLIQTYTPSNANSMTLFTLVSTAVIAAPLYLGVVAEATSNQAIIDSIIAVSPISYLAGIMDYDYLRSSWFYQHMPYAGLRFNYTASGMLTVCYLITTFTLIAIKMLTNKLKLRTLGK